MFVFSRFKIFRTFALWLSSFNRPQIELNNSIFNRINIARIVFLLHQDGFAPSFYLPKHYVEQILNYAFNTECYADYNPEYGFKHHQYRQAEQAYGRSIMRGEYFNTQQECKTIKAIAEDSQLIAIAAEYLQAKPILMETRLWWNFVVDEASCDLRKGARTFHYDLDDYRCLIFCFYLTDVDLNSGPHVCVPGSHRFKKLSNLLSLNLNTSDADIAQYYGAENIMPIVGKAGFGFVEDKFIYHKAKSPTQGDRLWLYIQYGLNNYQINNQIKPQQLKSCVYST